MLTDLKLKKKTHSTNLEHCFTASMTTHSINVMSQLKMSSFCPYAGKHTRSIALSTALCWRPCQMSNSSSTSCELARLVHTLLEKAVT